MGCLDNIVTPDKSTPSRTGLYANLLPGVTLSLLDGLTKDEQEDYLEFWDDIYERTKINFVNDVQSLMSDKFHIDKKLVSRETSEFTTTTNTGTSAGLQIYFFMPKYARIYIVSIGVDSVDPHITPNADFYIYDTDTSGRLLDQISYDLSVGLNTIYVDQEYEVKERLFIGYNPSQLRLKQTVNRYFDNIPYSSFDKLSCSYPCFGSNFEATVYQINGGGLNVVFNIVCSIEKFICENINIFKNAFWWRIGVELMQERIMSDRFNRWTTLTVERAAELAKVYNDEYDKQLKNSTRNLRVLEDSYCFTCKSTVSAQPLLP